ncbi:NADPH-dependent aldehyde reductase ARI1 [Ceratobasidium sp. AG-Ba]|nr:NADPH-dependent aldehyde reductase ARI1 [Ceratobasidium sp. AG-Ba]
MPSVEPPANILVTGANGYFATYAVEDLLERGYTVTGSVRSARKGEEMKQLFARYGKRFSYVVVPDITEPTAFDQVIRENRFDGVAHAASPVNPQPGGTTDEYFRPAVTGTINILESIKKFGPSVKRVVYTSSCATVLHDQEGIQHTEAHWNENVLKTVEEKGNKSSHREMYRASKTLAEKAAWKYVNENKGHINYDLVTALPSYVSIAPMHNVASRDQLTSTNAVASSIRQPRPASEYTDTAYWFIHVKDMAALHSAAFSEPDAAGHRILGVAGDASWQDIYDALNEYPAFPKVPRGNPRSRGRPDSGSKDWDTSYSRRLLGREFIGIKQSFRETEEYYQKKGWAFMP